ERGAQACEQAVHRIGEWRHFARQVFDGYLRKVLLAAGFELFPERPEWPRPLSHRKGNGAECHRQDRKSTRLNSSHVKISYAVFCDRRALHSFPTRRSSDLNAARRRASRPFIALASGVTSLGRSSTAISARSFSLRVSSCSRNALSGRVPFRTAKATAPNATG